MRLRAPFSATTALRDLAGADREGECRVVCNVKLFTEGVDVPQLDAVAFLDPRDSQVDVVQAVGRVMRKAPGKRFGYIIIPVIVEPGSDVAAALARGTEGYGTVGRVLRSASGARWPLGRVARLLRQGLRTDHGERAGEFGRGFGSRDRGRAHPTRARAAGGRAGDLRSCCRCVRSRQAWPARRRRDRRCCQARKRHSSGGGTGVAARRGSGPHPGG